ncbi:MAG TPA: hypothetical protein VHL78_06475, partial [Actinomycetota bacterium]|nr:hypothetical protein [Actinomycetota bacterium]
MTAATTLARLLLAVTAAALVASGCGSGAPERPAAGGREGASLTEVRITLTDDGFELEGPVEAEPVRFVLRNGTDAPRVAFFAAVNEGVSRRE